MWRGAWDDVSPLPGRGLLWGWLPMSVWTHTPRLSWKTRLHTLQFPHHPRTSQHPWWSDWYIRPYGDPTIKQALTQQICCRVRGFALIFWTKGIRTCCQSLIHPSDSPQLLLGSSPVTDAVWKVRCGQRCTSGPSKADPSVPGLTRAAEINARRGREEQINWFNTQSCQHLRTVCTVENSPQGHASVNKAQEKLMFHLDHFHPFSQFRKHL